MVFLYTMDEKEKTIFTCDGQLLSAEAIIRIEEIAYETFLFLQDGTQSKSVLSIDVLEWELPKEAFVRVHPNHLINRQFTKKLFTVHSQWIELENGEKIPTTHHLLYKKNIFQKGRTAFKFLNSIIRLPNAFLKSKYHG